MDKNSLQATPEQIKQKVEEFATNYDDPEQAIKWFYEDEKRLEEPRALATEDNVVDWFLKQCKKDTKKIELAEKQNQQVVVQNQGSSTVRVIDVTRENENNMRRSMGLINGTCTLATYYSC